MFLVVKPFLRELLWQYPEKIVSCILWGSNYFMKNNKPIDAKSFPTLANKITYPAELITYNEGGSKFKDYAEIVKSYGNVDQNEFISLKVIITQSFQKIKYNLNNLGENENLLKPFYPTLYQLFNLSMKGCSKWTKLLRKKYTTDNTRKLEIKWEESLGIRQGIFFWNRCYKNTYNISFNSKLKWLYYQTVRGTLKTNRIISKFKPQISPDCTFCNLETETIIHLFWDCTIVKKFIKDCYDHIETEYPVFHHIFTLKDFIFGLREDVCSPRNYCALYIKYFIWLQRCCKKDLSITGFKTWFLRELRIDEKNVYEKRLSFLGNIVDKNDQYQFVYI